jgi:hypothetical protein
MYHILIEIGLQTKIIWLTKMYLDQKHSKICTGIFLSYTFPIQNGLKQ